MFSGCRYRRLQIVFANFPKIICFNIADLSSPPVLYV